VYCPISVAGHSVPIKKRYSYFEMKFKDDR